MPLRDPALTVTEPVPDEVRVTDFEAAAATVIVPKLRLVALSDSLDVSSGPILRE